MKKCTWEGCEARHHARGYCANHYPKAPGIKEKMLAKQRERRRQTQNALTLRYEKTPHGFLMRLYRNMKSRISGVQRLKAHLYAGKYLLPKDEFYAWASNHPRFLELFEIYKLSGFQRALAPSVDRIDSSNGYSLNNMEWVTHSENSSRGSINRHRRLQ
jgi:hypothetical protein